LFLLGRTANVLVDCVVHIDPKLRKLGVLQHQSGPFLPRRDQEHARAVLAAHVLTFSVDDDEGPGRKNSMRSVTLNCSKSMEEARFSVKNMVEAPRK
jgi:hypothetical protein